MGRHRHYSFGRAVRSMERAARASARAEMQIAKAQMREQLEKCLEEAKRVNHEIESHIASLGKLLVDNLTQQVQIPTEHPPAKESINLPTKPDKTVFRWVIPVWFFAWLGLAACIPNLFALLISLGIAFGIYRLRKSQVEQNILTYEEQLSNETARVERINSQNLASFNTFVSDYNARQLTAIEEYFSLCLEQLHVPDGYSATWDLAYNEASHELVVQFELPTRDIVPTIQSVKFVKTRLEFDQKERKAADIAKIYQSAIQALSLAVVGCIFTRDKDRLIKVLTLNAFVNTTDLATGKNIQPCLISVRCTHETFGELDLSRVDTTVCLRNLGAKSSPSAYEMLPVKPIVEFNMVDRRFVEQPDVLSGIDDRPNIMDLTPTEFEALVANLFQKMGLETKLTRSHKDGGVDAVAYDRRPVIGGKIVIQAKRYSHTVGVSAVRDLYGTMQHEGANKGILVTTSAFGPDAYEFSKDKPIELLDGSHLIYLLAEHGTQARIVFPTVSH